MNRKEAAELSPFIKAFGEGKDIEIRSKNPHAQLNGWVKMDEFIFGNFEYRIKPQPKYRPFKDAEECWNEMLKHQPFGWTKINSNDFNIITTINTCVCLNDISISYIDAFDNYTFADGAPFGVKVEEQSMKIRLAKKIMKADTYADYPSKHPSPYWKAKFKKAYNEYGCVMFCEDSSKCKYRNKFDHRIKKAISLTI